jgi:signal transduction histidine kinase
MAAGNAADDLPRPPLSYRLTGRQWLAIDVTTALLGACWVIFALRVHGPHGQLPTMQVALLSAAATLPVAVRRVAPVPVLAVITVAISWLTALGRAPLNVDIMLGMAIYLVAMRGRRRDALIALGCTELVLICGVLAAAAASRRDADTVHSMLAAAAMWFAGDGVRERRRYQAERARLAVREERVRIARELHDVVAHTLSVVTFQAGVGRKVGVARPEQALLALRSVEVTGRGALEELRRILGLLRDDAEVPSLRPAPGIGELTELAGTVQAAGITVRMDIAGDTATLAPAEALTVYRIVQEALTNVVKHAPGSAAAVQVRAGPDGVLIIVTDNGRGSGTALTAVGDAPRHGILGMRERATAFGGTLDAGAVPGGGFRVTAFLPVPRDAPAGEQRGERVA